MPKPFSAIFVLGLGAALLPILVLSSAKDKTAGPDKTLVSAAPIVLADEPVSSPSAMSVDVAAIPAEIVDDTGMAVLSEPLEASPGLSILDEEAVPGRVRISPPARLHISDEAVRTSANVDREQMAVRSVIDAELRDSTLEERDIWFEELKNLPPEVVRDLLQVRRQMRQQQLRDSSPQLAMKDPVSALSVPVPIDRSTTTAPAFRPAVDAIDPQWEATVRELEKAIRITQHHLLNAETIGFKRQQISLVDAYDSNASLDGERPLPTGVQLGRLRLDLSQGGLISTERPWDVAIVGSGFFPIRQGEHQVYTRCGSFSVNRDGKLYLSTIGQEAILDVPWVIPANAVLSQVGEDGAVLVTSPGETEPRVVGRIPLVRFRCSEALTPLGKCLFACGEETGEPIVGDAGSPGLGHLTAESLEISNVQVERESELLTQFQASIRIVMQNAKPVTPQ